VTRTAARATLCALAVLAPARAAPAADDAAVARGEAVLRAAGGCTCHTNYPVEGDDAPRLAGGRGLETPFGVFYSTNLTPDRATGIGAWSDADFLRAMTRGLSPDGSHYFPVFPYTSFAGMTREDLLDLKAYLFSLDPVRRESRPLDAPPPFRWRWTVGPWKWLHFDPAPFEPDASRAAAWNRGAYLAGAVAHCGECHTPRTFTGGLDRARWLAGSARGPEGELAPNITPHAETGIGDWSAADLAWYLETGIEPDGDSAQGLMSELIEHGYAHMPRADLEAMATYVLSLPPIDHAVKPDLPAN